jgi:hypothetical protein
MAVLYLNTYALLPWQTTENLEQIQCLNSGSLKNTATTRAILF